MFSKSEQEFAEQKFKMEVTIMNIFRTKVKEVKIVYTKVADITILGQKFNSTRTKLWKQRSKSSTSIKICEQRHKKNIKCNIK